VCLRVGMSMRLVMLLMMLLVMSSSRMLREHLARGRIILLRRRRRRSSSSSRGSSGSLHLLNRLNRLSERLLGHACLVQALRQRRRHSLLLQLLGECRALGQTLVRQRRLAELLSTQRLAHRRGGCRQRLLG